MEIEDFDDIFPFIGGFGPYQYIIFAIICFFNFIFCFINYGQIFMTLTPPHWCSSPPGFREEMSQLFNVSLSEENLKQLTIPTDEDGLQFSKCFMYNFSIDQIISEDGIFKPNSSWPTVKCQYGWSYDFSLYYPTISSQLNWVCDEDWRPPFAQTLFFIGSMIGVPFFGWLADRFGRIPIIMATNLVGGVFGIASSLCHSFVLFCVLRFIVGLAYDSNFYVIFILGLEYVSAEHRSTVANVPILIFLTASMCSLPWIAYFIHDWSLFGVILHIPFFFPLVLPWIAPESARWLLSKGKIDKATEIVKKAARINRKTLSPEFLDQFQKYAKSVSEKSSEKVSLFDLFKTPNLRKRVIALGIMWISIILAYDGHVRHTENLGSNIFISFTLMGAVELPGDLLTIFLMEWFGRKHTTIWSLIFAGIAAAAIIFVKKSETYLLLGLAVCGRFLITMAINVGQQYIVEVLPTVGRAQGSAAIHTAGLGMAFASPYIVYLSKFEHWLPYLIFGAISVIGGVACFLLPETLGEKLPDSLQDGEEYFKDQPLFYNPFKKDKNKTEEKYLSRRHSVISRTNVSISPTFSTSME